MDHLQMLHAMFNDLCRRGASRAEREPIEIALRCETERLRAELARDAAE